jgi:hypothetical protein
MFFRSCAKPKTENRAAGLDCWPVASMAASLSALQCGGGGAAHFRRFGICFFRWFLSKTPLLRLFHLPDALALLLSSFLPGSSNEQCRMPCRMLASKSILRPLTHPLTQLNHSLGVWLSAHSLSTRCCRLFFFSSFIPVFLLAFLEFNR